MVKYPYEMFKRKKEEEKEEEYDASIEIVPSRSESDVPTIAPVDGIIRIKNDAVYTMTSRVIRSIYQITISDEEEYVIGKIESRNLRYSKLVDEHVNNHTITEQGFNFKNDSYQFHNNYIYYNDQKILRFFEDGQKKRKHHIRFLKDMPSEWKKWFCFFVFAHLAFFAKHTN